MEKAKKIKERREQEEELAELRQNEILADDEKSRRRQRAAVVKVSREAEEALEKLRVCVMYFYFLVY